MSYITAQKEASTNSERWKIYQRHIWGNLGEIQKIKKLEKVSKKNYKLK